MLKDSFAPQKITLIGAGGHGLVVLDAACLAYPDAIIEVRDDNVDSKIANLLGLHVIKPAIHSLIKSAHLAIGDNKTREQLRHQLSLQGCELITIVHPDSTISNSAIIGEGTFIAAKSILGPLAEVGKNCIINHAAVIDHECHVGNGCHIGPNATLGGQVTVEEQCFIGANATLLPGIRIGKNSTIGAGAVVAKNVGSNSVMIGVPARKR